MGNKSAMARGRNVLNLCDFSNNSRWEWHARWLTRPNGMVETDSSQWNAGGDSSDQGTLGCPPKADSSDQGTLGCLAKGDSSGQGTIGCLPKGDSSG